MCKNNSLLDKSATCYYSQVGIKIVPESVFGIIFGMYYVEGAIVVDGPSRIMFISAV